MNATDWMRQNKWPSQSRIGKRKQKLRMRYKGRYNEEIHTTYEKLQLLIEIQMEKVK